MGAAEIGLAEIGSAQVGPKEMAFSEVNPAEIGFPEVGPKEMGSAEVGSAEVGPKEIGSAEIRSAEMPSAFWNIPSNGGQLNKPRPSLLFCHHALLQQMVPLATPERLVCETSVPGRAERRVHGCL